MIESVPSCCFIHKYYCADYPDAAWSRHLRDEQASERILTTAWGMVGELPYWRALA